MTIPLRFPHSSRLVFSNLPSGYYLELAPIFLGRRKAVVLDAEIVTDTEPAIELPGKVQTPESQRIVSGGSGKIWLTQIEFQFDNEGIRPVRQRFRR